MTFEEEWARRHADAATRTRLDQAPAGDGSHGDLSHEEREKRQAAAYIRETLGPQVQKAGAKADGGSQAVAGGTGGNGCLVGALRGWETEKGLDDCLATWDRQVKALTTRLSGEASALTTTNTLFSGNESVISSRFTRSGPRDAPGAPDTDGRAQ
ncbi:hypothetical protein [Streptomyces sp. Z26]|uniref:hypothetical protein n=1 Tax=Streptomyces sp. Z26 TaxID=2500177 RepID=UPI000EF13F37|nr:hypothetical protein [Streptomyces sp. Z26]RLL67108.1 hypothetical protein D7M15_09780 [Streptomyces sp. Z26]